MEDIKKEIMGVLAKHGKLQTNLSSTSAQERIMEDIAVILKTRDLYIVTPGDTINYIKDTLTRAKVRSPVV